MAKAFVFYNPLAGNGMQEEKLSALTDDCKDEVIFCNMTDTEAYEKALLSLEPEDYIILCGGDGTLNRFINLTDKAPLDNEIYYYPCGSGNDFAHDLGKKQSNKPFCVTKYLKELPYIEVNGKKCRFLNGIGYGIDGYCCEVGDELKKRSNKAVNYTSIAIKGLMFHYKPTAATITVDGVTRKYNRVWLAPTMNGRFFGGGMMPTLNQDRLNPEKKLSVMLFHNSGKLRALVMFPSLFSGTHVKYTKHVEVLSGKDITVEFDRPTALQIDGETVRNVTSYRATSCTEAAARQISEPLPIA